MKFNTRIYKDGMSGYYYAVFKRNEVEHKTCEQIITDCNFYTRYRGPGKLFTEDAYVIRKGSRVLVKQFWGYDI